MARNITYVFLVLFLFCTVACQSTAQRGQTSLTDLEEQQTEQGQTLNYQDTSSQQTTPSTDNNTITMLFAGDIMAHQVNYKVSSFDKIWQDLKPMITETDLAFANIESPIDTTKPESTYPNFNMTEEYVQAAINAGFDVFSLANNHSFDQFENGIKQTIITTNKLSKTNPNTYFSGLKNNKADELSYNVINKNGFTILFVPITQILNYPHNPEYINYVKPKEEAQNNFILWCKILKSQTKADLLIISLHANEPEYTRTITEKQKLWYLRLLNEADADVIWANHAHIIKDRLFVFNSTTESQKMIMFANGNTISGQRTKPDFKSPNPTGERDNTGDGLFCFVTFSKNSHNKINIQNVKNVFITTYINTAWEFVLKPLNQDFVDYLQKNKRKDWAEYIQKRIQINENATKDLILWQ